MKKSVLKNTIIAILLVVAVTTSCRKDFDFKISSGNLSFSKDTVYLDTVFTNIGSSTYTLKVYNQENEDVFIPSIRLRTGQESSYRLNVDGTAGKEFTNVPLLAKDSMFIFIETTFDIAAIDQNEFLYTDAIEFDTTGDSKSVELVSLVKDAVFLFPQTLDDGLKETLLLGEDGEGNEIRIEGFFLEDSELNFTNEKPYVIYGYAAVSEGKILTIAAGSRVHFHENSGILIGFGGSIQVFGELSEDQETLENEVIFEGDRLEPNFSDLAGQWGAIWITPGSINNTIAHLTLKNATVGLLVDGMATGNTTTLSLSNSQIYNSSTTNLWARTAKIQVENTVFGNSGAASVYCNLGGDYSFKHSTIANYWSSGFRNAPALLVDNFISFSDGSSIGADLVAASFANCIIDGNKRVEFILESNESNIFEFNLKHSSIRFNDNNGDFVDNPLFNFDNLVRYESLFLNLNTDFTNARANLFTLQETSEVLDLGALDIGLEVPTDILNTPRTLTPDLGAYEFIEE